MRERLDGKLLENVKTALPKLEELLKEICGHWTYEDMIYRFYHHSFKVFRVQDATRDMVNALQDLLPEKPLNAQFMEIVKSGTGKSFTLAVNQNWMPETRPMVEAFFHAKYFLEMVVKYGKELEAAPNMLPSGWATVLYLFDER